MWHICLTVEGGWRENLCSSRHSFRRHRSVKLHCCYSFLVCSRLWFILPFLHSRLPAFLFWNSQFICKECSASDRYWVRGKALHNVILGSLITWIENLSSYSQEHLNEQALNPGSLPIHGFLKMTWAFLTQVLFKLKMEDAFCADDLIESGEIKEMMEIKRKRKEWERRLL